MPKSGNDCRCAIHSRLAASGFAGCAAYDCLGAGQIATAMFAGLDLACPAVCRARLDAFARLMRLQVLRLALTRFGREVALPKSYAELLLIDVAALRRVLQADAAGAELSATDQMPRFSPIHL